ncbi:hypothetical protein DM02DRAFT_615328 [Periconia macrospinosa]|uniref:REJ domain-containing protein n=1 Tax=Periconia macrospinosa TaxID=97972 RepID=A0A2V1DLR7_9PLEO|nr:hypothetical protein DM02DRAFT_615328 [Periconia macrospinosa]
MIVALFFWLLAASSSLVIAGPLPLQFRSPFYPYFRNSTAISSAPALLTSSKSSEQLPSTTSNPISEIAEANTAIVVEPIGRTIITHTQPAITFLDPKGRPLITQAVETLLSTSFFTQSKPTPSRRASSQSSSIPASASPPAISSVRTSTVKASPPSSVAATSSKLVTRLPSNGTVAITTSSPNAPYSSKEGNRETISQGEQQSINSSSLISTTTKSMLSTATIRQSSNQLQGTTSASSTPSNAAAIPTIQRPTSRFDQSAPEPQNTSTKSGFQPGRDPTPSRSVVFVTQTDYTTVTPSVASTSKIASTSISSVLPSTSLSPPPAVTITSSIPTPQTSITPTSAPSLPSSVVSGTGAASQSSAASLTAKPSGGGNGGSGFQYPTRSSAIGSAPTTAASPSTASTSASSNIPAASSSRPTASPSVPASSISNTPLIVTPINPSQLFTITVTATTTQKETAMVTTTVKD